MSHEFTIRIDRALNDDEVEALYARSDDTTVTTSEDKTYVDFDRDATDLESAIRSAIADLTALGHQPANVEIEPASISA